MSREIRISGVRGLSGTREAIVGFAPASTLSAFSFADVLDEETRVGYQRRFSSRHSLDFSRYILRDGSTTIPLTFNLRPGSDGCWRLESCAGGTVRLCIRPDAGRILSQVDCQHRLGFLAEHDVALPFMIFVGLSVREEMEVFNTINSKARGLSGSLLDYHRAQLATDLGLEKPELLIAFHLNESETSPWRKQLDLGGNGSTGLKRRASLRTMQKALKRFLSATQILRDSTLDIDRVASLVEDFWIAVSTVLERQWFEPRRHFLTKGVGVYALSGLMGDFWLEAKQHGRDPNAHYFSTQLAQFAVDFDWTKSGPLKGFGGESGALEALQLLRAHRASELHSLLRVANG